MSAVSDSSHACCVTQQACLVCHTADMSALSHNYVLNGYNAEVFSKQSDLVLETEKTSLVTIKLKAMYSHFARFQERELYTYRHIYVSYYVLCLKSSKNTVHGVYSSLDSDECCVSKQNRFVFGTLQHYSLEWCSRT